MKKQILNFFVGVIFIYANTLQSQTTINYSTFVPNPNSCNIFGLGATVNGVAHQTTYGQPQYNSSNGSVKLSYDYNSNAQKGSEFKIAYNFQQGFTYKITVFERNATTSPINIATSVRVSIGDNGSGNNCNGAELISSSSGNPSLPLQVASTIFIGDGFIFNNPLSIAASYCRISTYSTSQPSPTTQTIEIQKVIIEEIQPAANFTISPTNVSIPCGSTSPVTFTCNNINSTPNVSGYIWNVGNGWSLLNGTPITSPIYTQHPVNSIVIKPNTFPLSNVLVSPLIGLAQQNLGPRTCIVTLSPFTSSATITGLPSFCTFPTTSNYTISAGAGNTVTWSSSNTDVATVSAGTNSQVTVTTQSQGFFTLTALITNACGQTSTKTKLISVGGPTFGSFTFGGKGGTGSLCISPVDNLSFSIPQLNTNDKITANYTGLTSAERLLNSNWEFLPLNDLITLNGTAGSRRVCANKAGSTGVTVRVRNACGWSAWTDLLFDIVEIPPVNQRIAIAQTIFAISPNPSSDFISINMKDNENINLKNQSITAELIDMLFVSRKRFEIQNENPLIDVKNIEKGIYILKITIDGHTENHQVIIK